jgi:TonB family protein
VLKRSMSLAMASLLLAGMVGSAVGSETTAGVPQEPVDLRGIWTGTKLDKKRAAARGLDAAAMQPPRKVKNAYPDYPYGLGVRGPVDVECVIDKEGVPTDCSVSRGLHSLLDAAALRCVQEWRFSPLTIDGVATPALVEFHFSFKSEREWSERD